MDVLDINGKKISTGLHVKYTGTHTVGKVNKILIKGDNAWIKFDSNGMYYRSDFIEIIDGNGVYKKVKKVKRVKSKSDRFKIQIPVEISDSSDGPGVGGG